MSETLENGCDDVPCTGKGCQLNGHDRETKVGRQRDSPLFALILYFIAQIKDDLPVLTGQGLICRFRFFVEERMRIMIRVVVEEGVGICSRTDDVVVRICGRRLEHGMVILRKCRRAYRCTMDKERYGDDAAAEGSSTK